MKALLLSLSLLADAGGHPRAGHPAADRAPVRITCDDMVVLNRQQTARCEGHVVAKRLLLTVTCDHSLAHYDPDGHIEDLTCRDNVRIVEKDRVATGDKAVYLEDERTIELSGHATLKQKDDVLNGEPIVFFVDEDRVVAKGARLRGKAGDLPPSDRDGGVAKAHGR